MNEAHVRLTATLEAIQKPATVNKSIGASDPECKWRCENELLQETNANPHMRDPVSEHGDNPADACLGSPAPHRLSTDVHRGELKHSMAQVTLPARVRPVEQEGEFAKHKCILSTENELLQETNANPHMRDPVSEHGDSALTYTGAN
jgi:hypothetical protein